jgi:RNA polymerase sigma-70 factor (ECF subfamily)
MKKSDPPDQHHHYGEAYYEGLYKQYFPRLYNFARQFTRNDVMAEDLVHEAFLKLWERMDDLDPDRVDKLLFRMVRNLCLNQIRHLKVVQNAELDLEKLTRWDELYRIEFIRDEPIMLIEKELEQKISEIMASLPDRCREVFRLSRIDGLKNRQIAEKLDISLKTVEKHIHQALVAFRHELPALVPIQLIILALSLH